MNDKQSIGAKIKTLRQRKRWTQEHLVEVAREYVPEGYILNRPNISMYENGRTRPDSWSLIAIARALGVTVEYLTGEERAPAMLTPEPELWTAVEEANKQRPEVRTLLANVMVAAMNYARVYAGEAVNSFPPETSTEGERRAQELAAWVGQPADQLLLTQLLHDDPDALRDTPESDAQADAPNSDSAPAGTNSHSG